MRVWRQSTVSIFLLGLCQRAFAFDPITFSSDADYSNNNPPTSGLFRHIGPTNRWPLINFFGSCRAIKLLAAPLQSWSSGTVVAHNRGPVVSFEAIAE